MARPELSAGAAWMAGRILPVAEAAIPVTDWGLTRSDITYDVVPVWDGAFFRIDDYLDRFLASVAKLRLEIGEDRAAIARILHDMVAATGLRAAYVSMVASRGRPRVPGSRDPRACVNYFYAWAVPYVWIFTQDVIARGAHLHMPGNVTRIAADAVDPSVKNYHWGDMTQALFAALDAGYDSTLLRDGRGMLTEGPGFNVFTVTGSHVATPVRGVLGGITRRTALEICVELGLPAEERDIPEEECLAADEVFLTTSGGGIVPVTRIGGRIYGNGAPGPVASAIRERYWDWMKRPELIRPVDYGEG